MLKKYRLIFVVLLALTSHSAFSGMWILVSSQINVGTFYCTYKLSGSNPPIVKTIESSTSCVQVLTD